MLLTAVKPSTHGEMREFKRKRLETSRWTSTRRWKKQPRIVVLSVVTRSRMRHETATHLSITGRQRIQTFNSHKARKRGVLFAFFSNVVGPHPNLGVGWTFCMVGLSEPVKPPTVKMSQRQKHLVLRKFIASDLIFPRVAMPVGTAWRQ